MTKTIILFLAIIFVIWVCLEWDKKTMRVILLLLLPFSGFAQDTLNFDYWITTNETDSFYSLPSTIVIDTEMVTIRTPYEYYTRYITATGLSRSGDKVLFFANCDKIRLTKSGGVVDGVFLSVNGLNTYYGQDEKIRENYGWTNK